MAFGYGGERLKSRLQYAGLGLGLLSLVAKKVAKKMLGSRKRGYYERP